MQVEVLVWLMHAHFPICAVLAGTHAYLHQPQGPWGLWISVQASFPQWLVLLWASSAFPEGWLRAPRDAARRRLLRIFLEAGPTLPAAVMLEGFAFLLCFIFKYCSSTLRVWGKLYFGLLQFRIVGQALRKDCAGSNEADMARPLCWLATDSACAEIL